MQQFEEKRHRGRSSMPRWKDGKTTPQHSLCVGFDGLWRPCNDVQGALVSHSHGSCRQIARTAKVVLGWSAVGQLFQCFCSTGTPLAHAPGWARHVGHAGSWLGCLGPLVCEGHLAPGDLASSLECILTGSFGGRACRHSCDPCSLKCHHLLVLDCCRDYGRLSCWHRFLLHLTCDKPLVVKRSRRTSRPNFFKTFACEDGFQALGPPFGCGYLTQAFLQALKTLRPGGSLDELLTTMDQHVRESCSGLQKICVYSTSYRLSKQIIFWDEQADVVAVPTLLTMRKDHLLSLKPSELRLFHRHRQTSDPKERKEIFLLPTLSDDLRAMLLLRSLADKKSARGRSSKRMCWKEIHGHIMTTNGKI